MAQTITLSNAKAELSSIVKKVKESGARYVVTVRDKPAALIVPLQGRGPEQLKGFGALAGRRPQASREEEKAAWAEAMEAKHDEVARR